MRSHTIKAIKLEKKKESKANKTRTQSECERMEERAFSVEFMDGNIEQLNCCNQKRKADFVAIAEPNEIQRVHYDLVCVNGFK